MQVLLAAQKAELAQLHARQTELQLAAVEREAAAQDLYVRLEAAQGDLCGERERGDRAAAQLAGVQQQLQVCARMLWCWDAIPCLPVSHEIEG